MRREIKEEIFIARKPYHTSPWIRIAAKLWCRRVEFARLGQRTRPCESQGSAGRGTL